MTSSQKSKISLRTCIGCKKRFPTDSLLRISFDGQFGLQLGDDNGRGAWICRDNSKCCDKALNPYLLSRHLRQKISKEMIDLFRENITLTK